jgi:hypothetical protein
MARHLKRGHLRALIFLKPNDLTLHLSLIGTVEFAVGGVFSFTLAGPRGVIHG